MFRPDANPRGDVGAEFDEAERKLAQRGRRADWEALAFARAAVSKDPVCAHEALDGHVARLNKPVEVRTPAGATKELPVAIDQAVVDELERILEGVHCTGPACDRSLPAWQGDP
jgi:hypothetical protein